MAAPEKGLVFTGARARLMINGIKIGWATNVSGSEEIQYEPAEVLDNIQVQEHVPVRYTCALSMGEIRIVNKTLKSQGFFPSIGGNPDEHLQNILTSGELTVAIEDSQTAKLIASYEQCKAAAHNFTINATGIVGTDVSFVAIRTKDESEI